MLLYSEHTHSAFKLSRFLCGQPVLSIGCGSPISTEEDRGHNNGFEVWFPRLSWIYGAKPIIGIDLFEGDPKDIDVYDHRKANIVPLLTAPSNMFTFLSDASLVGRTAVVQCRAVFGWTNESSPTFRRILDIHGIGQDDIETFEQLLATGLYSISTQILKEGGLLIFNDNYSVFRHGNLFLMHTEDKGWLDKPELIYPIDR